MDAKLIEKIFADTAYVRVGGSDEELRTAKYIQSVCADMGLTAELEPFDVDMANIKKAVLTVDGKEITCKGYLCAGSGEVEAPLYYLTDTDRQSLAQCKGKIVLFDGYLRYWIYHDMLDNGAVGCISYDGNANYADRDIDQRELRSYVSKGRKVPCVNINAKDAIEIVNSNAKTAKIQLEQDEYKGNSHNVVLDLPGENGKTIVLTAHYDSTSLSQGAYDNMSGSIGLIGIAQYFANHPHKFGLRSIWCGSEERGLLGSKAYCAAHEEELKDIDFVVNLDMIGSIMGKFIACCTSEEKLVHYISYMGFEKGFQVSAYQDVYSSDSTPFADKGVPAVSFARAAAGNVATIHNSYDTVAVMKTEHMQEDIDFIIKFVDRMANAVTCPVAKEMPDNMKQKLDEYLFRKRP
ncbi:MAG: Zn-dependent exopeptidase M28 [Oscillospiraceae bacterium]|nr:Zn-dependent exopeptidase M28 [Oscillospiraceae bacterium]